MNELIVFAALSSLIAVQTLATIRERKEWAQERSRLLDRIMAKTYNEFVHTVTMTTAEAPTPISDEAWHKQNYAEHPELYPDGPDVAE